MDWYYAKGTQRQGPLDWQSFHQRVSEGDVTGATLVWHEGLVEWQPFRQIAHGPVYLQQAQEAGSNGHAFCTRCERLLGQDDLIEFGNDRICAACKEPYFQAVRQGTAGVVSAEPGLDYAGFWIRFVAKLIDGAIMWGVSFGLSMLALGLESVWWQLLWYPSAIGYYTVLHGRYGASVGKLALGLRVVRPDGGRITYLRAFGRGCAEILSMFLNIGYIIAGFDDRKRALHDYIAGTRVVYKSSLQRVRNKP